MSNDAAGFDFLPEVANIGGTVVPEGTLLWIDGDEAPSQGESVYAINKDTGAVIASQELGTLHTTSGAYHPGRDSVYIANWLDDKITEVDPSSGVHGSEFSVASDVDWFYGGLDISQANGPLFLVDNTTDQIVELDANGSFVRAVDLAPFGITDISGISLDDSTGDAWIATLGGQIYQLGGIAMSLPEPTVIGDMTGDGLVNLDDVSMLILALVDRDAYDAAYPFVNEQLAGDISFNGVFDLGDIRSFSALFSGPAMGSAQAVPEPTTLSLAVVLLMATAIRRRRRGC